MFDRNKFLDIEPYFDEKQCNEACARIKAHPEIIYAIATALFPVSDENAYEKRKMFTGAVISRLDEVHSYDDFQKKITIGVFLPTVLSNSADSFTFSGLDKLSADTSYLFVSNHRDIVLDCALLDLALFKSGLPLCEMAIGDNLLANQLIEDIFKLNGAIIVKRDLPFREKYLETIRLSEYFVGKIESGKSIWVAQKSGRSKDGKDVTHPSIIKMLYLDRKREGVSFADVIKTCRIVPVAVSYEYDPNDISKAREEVETLSKGHYEKKKHEDVFSMIRGLRLWKGNIHISFGPPLTDRAYTSAEEVAAEVDRQIHSLYRLCDTNWFSYDYINGNEDNRDKYEGFDSNAFLSRYSHLNSEVRAFILNSYANPVRSCLEAVR